MVKDIIATTKKLAKLIISSKKIKKQLLELKSKIESTKKMMYPVGHVDKPGEDCKHIKFAIPNAKSGFYFIKP